MCRISGWQVAELGVSHRANWTVGVLQLREELLFIAVWYYGVCLSVSILTVCLKAPVEFWVSRAFKLNLGGQRAHSLLLCGHGPDLAGQFSFRLS